MRNRRVRCRAQAICVRLSGRRGRGCARGSAGTRQGSTNTRTDTGLAGRPPPNTSGHTDVLAAQTLTVNTPVWKAHLTSLRRFGRSSLWTTRCPLRTPSPGAQTGHLCLSPTGKRVATTSLSAGSWGSQAFVGGQSSQLLQLTSGEEASRPAQHWGTCHQILALHLCSGDTCPHLSPTICEGTAGVLAGAGTARGVAQVPRGRTSTFQRRGSRPWPSSAPPEPAAWPGSRPPAQTAAPAARTCPASDCGAPSTGGPVCGGSNVRAHVKLLTLQN